MTDNELIKALECCTKAFNGLFGFACKKCPANTRTCMTTVMKEALDIINRQKAEIDRLSDRNHKCIYLSDEETTEYCVDGPCPKFKTEAQIKSAGIKEFAERLKEHYSVETTDNTNNPFVTVLYDADELIDNLVKEMTNLSDEHSGQP